LKSLAHALFVLPVILFMVIMNVLLSTTMSIFIFLQLIWRFGWTNNMALIPALISAVGVYAYILFQPKLQTYIKQKE